MVTTPADLGFSTVSTWRPYQANVVERILESDKKLIIVDAPTGSGKSMIALGVARAALPFTTTILTHQKILQEQYMEYEFDHDPPVKAIGKGNFMCILPDNEHKRVSEAPCNYGFKCELKWECPYFEQLRKANEAQVRVLNYPMFIEQAKGFNFQHQSFLICDEGHKVDKAILNAAGSELSTKDMVTLRKAVGKFDMPKVYNPNIKHNGHVQHFIETMSEDLLRKIRIDILNNKLVNRDEAQLLQKLRKIDRVFEHRGVIHTDWQGSMCFKPVMSEEWAEPMLLRYADKVVLMSATIIGGHEYWSKRLGLHPSEAEYISVPSSFPIPSRPIFFVPTVQMNERIWSRDDELSTLINRIDQIIRGYLPHKGLIHTTNKKLAAFIQSRSQFKDIMFVGGAEVLDKFKEAKVGVYVSYSATEGIDLPDDLCRFVIFAKVPWLPKMDPVVQVQMEEIPGFYAYEAASSIVQGVGRAMRHEGDWSVSFILDNSWRKLYRETEHLLPSWFKEAYQESGSPPLPQ